MTPEKVKQLFEYDPNIGDIRWKVSIGQKVKAGKIAGTVSSGRRCVMVDYTNYKVHRIIWVLFYGEWPPCEIDHRDGNPLNNKIENLRLATRQQNAANVSKHYDNKTGFLGVSMNKKRFAARLGGKYLGTYDTPEEAAAVYNKAALELYGEFANVSRGSEIDELDNSIQGTY